MSRLYTVYFRGTQNIAADRVSARSARAAIQLAAVLIKTSAAYLTAREVSI